MLFQLKGLTRGLRHHSFVQSRMRLRLDEFAYRQFDDPTYAGTKITMKKELFMQKVNELLPGLKLVDG